MLVRDRMSRHPITTSPAATFLDARQVMRGSRVGELLVLDDAGKLVGIVTREDLHRVSASPATSLSKHELNYLLDQLTVEEIMTRDVITVTEDMALEEAGRIMADNKITALPVMRGGDLVGIITEFHLFDTLLDLFGARQPGVRITATVPGVRGTLAMITSAVSALGGIFVAIGSVEEPDPQRFVVTMKVQDVEHDALVAAVTPLVTQIEDVRVS